MTIPIIDVDSHIAEPPDLWTSRLSSKWSEVAPHVVHDERRGFDRWVVGNRKLSGVSGFAVAGWHEHPPKFPPTMALADQAAFEPHARLAYLDREGIYAQALYPNLLAFMLFAFHNVGEPEFVVDCIRAYNDFLIDFSEPAPDRIIALCALPFWDIEASIKELDRAHAIGHRGVLFIGKPHKLGLPQLDDPFWEPLLKAVEERDLSLNFHTGFSDYTEEEFVGQLGKDMTRAGYAKSTALQQLGPAETLADLTTSEVCIKYPKLKMVIVESGVGWMRYFLEMLDWQWVNSGAQAEYPDRELPSFYFNRQIYGSFWFEQESVGRIADLYPDNLMFETDFPHPTSLSPGPISSSKTPRETIATSIGGLDDLLQRKILYQTAAKLYHVKGPVDGW